MGRFRTGTLAHEPISKKRVTGESVRRPPPLKRYGFTVTVSGLFNVKSIFVSDGITTGGAFVAI